MLMRMIEVLKVIMPVLVMLGIGMFVNKKQLITDNGIKDLKSLLMNVCIPALMFGTFYRTTFTWSAAVIIALMLVFVIVAFLCGFGARKLLKVNQEVMPYLCTTIEGGMLGYALFILLFGRENLYPFALMDLGTALVLFTFVVTSLKLRTKSRVTAREVISDVVSPVNVAMFAGIIISVSGLGRVVSSSAAGSVLDEVLSFLSTPASALILLVVGYGIELSEVRWIETLKTIFARVVIFIVFGISMFYVVRLLFPGNPLYSHAAVLAFILPPSYLLSFFTKDEQEAAYVGSVLTVYTLLTIIGFSILVWFAV